MDRTRFGSNRPPASPRRSLKGIPTVLSGIIRTAMFVDFLLEELRLCRTEAEKEVVCSALNGARTRMRHLRKNLKKLLACETSRRADSYFVETDERPNPFTVYGLQASP